jgi:ribosomal protein S27AE
MFSKREAEGYLLVDHRDSPGISAEQAASVHSLLVVPGGTMLETATKNCSNCQAMVILNPLRTRDRFYCQKCDDYHCDRCALITKLTGICKPFAQVIDEVLAGAAKLSS